MTNILNTLVVIISSTGSTQAAGSGTNLADFHYGIQIIIGSSVLLGILFKPIKMVYRIFKNKIIYNKLKPFYTEFEVKKATEKYMPTKCQNVDPCQEEEPTNVHAYVTKEKLIPFFIKKVFNAKKSEKYYIILADSGMGKTTFIINLFSEYSKKIFKKHKMILLPLGHPDTDATIDIIQDKENTILLLDALDEDSKSLNDYKKRLNEIIEKTKSFQAIVITSRTQFFPSQIEEPKETGILKFGCEKGMHKFYKLYISPFDEKDINKYLKMKFNIFNISKRKRAKVIVEKSPKLMVRPMLLANIDDLIKREYPYQYPHHIYEEMVERWIQRERVDSKEELRKFSKELALDIYNSRIERKGIIISAKDIKQFADNHKIKLEDFEIKSRSLLNRNGEGQYKFAHKSILEYFVALDLFNNPDNEYMYEYDGFEQIEKFYYDMCIERFNLDDFADDFYIIKKIVRKEIKKLRLSDYKENKNEIEQFKDLKNFCEKFTDILATALNFYISKPVTTSIILHNSIIEHLTNLKKETTDYMRTTMVRTYMHEINSRKKPMNEIRSSLYRLEEIPQSYKKKLSGRKDNIREWPYILSTCNKGVDTKSLSTYARIYMYNALLSYIYSEKIMQQYTTKSGIFNIIVCPIILKAEEIRICKEKLMGFLCLEIESIQSLPKRKQEILNIFIDVCTQEINKYMNEINLFREKSAASDLAKQI